MEGTIISCRCIVSLPEHLGAGALLYLPPYVGSRVHWSGLGGEVVLCFCMSIRNILLIFIGYAMIFYLIGRLLVYKIFPVKNKLFNNCTTFENR